MRNLDAKDYVEAIHNPFDNQNITAISVISVGELKSIALKNKWGNPKLQKMHEFLHRFSIIDINAEDILNKYAEIDAFSQGRLNSRLLNMSARNMGKNDLWIAATASVLDATLLTTDNDFDHLNEEFFKVEKVSINI